MTTPQPVAPRGGRPQPQRPWWGLGDVAIGIIAAQVLSVFAIVLAYGAAGWDTIDDVPLWASALLQIPLWVGLGGSAAWASRTKGLGLEEDFGLRMRAADAPIWLVAGVLCQVVLLPLLYWPLLRLLDKTPDDLSEPARALSDRASGSLGWVVLALMVVVGAPFFEELFYRGLLLRSLQKRDWPSWAVVVGSAALFAAMHFQPLQFPGLFVFGVVLAMATIWTGRLGPAIWAHAGFNGATVVLLYLAD
ncbi:MAG: CPBP family intramembrane metalloprotease [Actinomycetia bacterium]|nr:CPBP family intramembrane metalloprotease [Actinomycetes bacterium]